MLQIGTLLSAAVIQSVLSLLVVVSPDQSVTVCQGFVRLDGRRHKRYVVVKRGKLCLYNTVSVRTPHSHIYVVHANNLCAVS